MESAEIDGGENFVLRLNKTNKICSTLKINVASFFCADFFVSLKTVTQCGEENSCLSNKLSELALAAFDEEGICVSKAGSWAFSEQRDYS